MGDSVAPLLKFVPNYHSTFLANRQRLAMPLSARSLGASLRIMIAQAKMAANDLRATAVREPVPEKMAKAGNPEGAYVHRTTRIDLGEDGLLTQALSTRHKTGKDFRTLSKRIFRAAGY